jgi:hypothetical protein
MRQGYEIAPEWLERVATSADSSQTRQLARFALDQWNGLLQSWEVREVKTRRSLYDLLSGILQIARTLKHHQYMTPVISGKDTFYFPVFAEACDYRGKDRPHDAVVTGLPVKSHRRPQTKKWGNTILKT